MPFLFLDLIFYSILSLLFLRNKKKHIFGKYTNITYHKHLSERNFDYAYLSLAFQKNMLKYSDNNKSEIKLKINTWPANYL